MSFSSVDDLVAEITAGKSIIAPFQKIIPNGATGVAGRYYDTWLGAGSTGTGVYSGAAGSWNQMTSASAGALPLNAAVNPDTRHLTAIGAMTTAATAIGGLWLCDYLAYQPSCVITGAPTALTTGALPRYATGDGVQVMVVTQTAAGAATPSLTLTYTDQGGTAGNVATAVTSIANSAPVAQLWGVQGPFLPLATGDTGVRSVASYSLATGTTGTVAFVYVKPLAFIPMPIVNIFSERDMLYQLANLPQIQDGACLGFIHQAAGALATASAINGYIQYAWG
jgi:hypothetical protein